MAAKKYIKKLALIMIALILVAAIVYTSFFLFKISSFSKKISSAPDQSQSFLNILQSFSPGRDITLAGSDTGRINILLMGLAGQGKAGTNLTDTMMVASINLKTDQVALLSIPRDLYVKRADGYQDKINTAYQSGLSSGLSNDEAAKGVEKTVEDTTGLNINYYIVLNFDGFIKIIDSVGGINIRNDRDIYDARYPGANFSYETFELKKGFYANMDGATALKYARERHDDPEGDFGRAKRQQQILQATKNKVFSVGTFLDVVAINNLFNALGDNIKTDIKPDEFGNFLELTKRIDTNNINNVVLDAWNRNSLLQVSHVAFGDLTAFVLIPRVGVGNYSEVRDLAQNLFDLNTLKRRQDEITAENATVAIINKSGDANLTSKIKSLLNDNFDYKNVVVLSDQTKDLEDSTSVYDLSQKSKPFTLNELTTKLPAQISVAGLGDNYKNDLGNTLPDMVIVLGKDLSVKYNMDKDNVDDYKRAEENN